MKIKDVLYETPEMTEEKLLELIEEHKSFLKSYLLKQFEDNKAILDEWDLIQEKKSKLTRSQRDQICSLVSVCLIKMTKGEEVQNKESN